MDKYIITAFKRFARKPYIYTKQVEGKILTVNTTRGPKKIGIRKNESVQYDITDIETGYLLLPLKYEEEPTIFNYLQCYKAAKEFYESEDYEKAMQKYKEFRESEG